MEMIYKPPEYTEPIAQKANVGFKFSKNMVLLESFLKQRKIPYDPTKLQDTAFGKGLIVDKDKGETLEQALERIV